MEAEQVLGHSILAGHDGMLPHKKAAHIPPPISNADKEETPGRTSFHPQALCCAKLSFPKI